MTPPLHLCIIPVMLGFAGACWLTACICPIPRFAGLGVFAPLLSPIVATVFAVWIQFRTRKKTKTALESRFALLFEAGAISGLLAMTTLLQLFLALAVTCEMRHVRGSIDSHYSRCRRSHIEGIAKAKSSRELTTRWRWSSAVFYYVNRNVIESVVCKVTQAFMQTKGVNCVHCCAVAGLQSELPLAPKRNSSQKLRSQN